MPIAMITDWTSSYEPLANITIQQNRIPYCKKYGYVPIFIKKDFPATDNLYRSISYEYIRMFLDAFKDKNIEWACSTPVDGLVTNMTIPLESFIEANPGFDMLVGTDINGPNNGNVLYKNSDWSIRYLNFLLSKQDEYRNHPWHETGIVIDTYKLHPDKIKALNQRALNSYEAALYPNQPPLDIFGTSSDWQPGDFMIHWPATSLQDRIRLANKYIPLVIN